MSIPTIRDSLWAILLQCCMIVLLFLSLAAQVQASPTLQSVLDAVRAADPHGKDQGWAYALTKGNALEGDWLIQSPDWWGREAADLIVAEDCSGGLCDPNLKMKICGENILPIPCQFAGMCQAFSAMITAPHAPEEQACLGHSDHILDYFHDTITSAETLADVATLDLPQGRFLGALQNAMMYLAHTGDKVHVRFLIGEGGLCHSDMGPFVQALVKDAKTIPHSQLVVTAGCANYGPKWWNHAKITAADGHTAIVGGHNMWGKDYLREAPVHDISMIVDGPAAGTAQKYASNSWIIVCGIHAPMGSRHISSFDTATGQQSTACPDFPDVPSEPGSGQTDVLVVSTSPNFAEPNSYGDVARLAAFSAAQSTIRMSQQDLAWETNSLSFRYWPEDVLTALAKAMLRGVSVEIVLSNYGATSGAGTEYWNLTTLAQAAEKMRSVVAAQPGAPSGHDLAELMCTHFVLSPIRFSSDNAWSGGQKIASHTKFWMVDDSMFYIGSNNIYPAHLHELGFIVDDQEAADWVYREFWQHIAHFSEFAGINGIGSNPDRCWFYHN